MDLIVTIKTFHLWQPVSNQNLDANMMYDMYTYRYKTDSYKSGLKGTDD